MNSVVQFLENIHQHMSPWQMSCFSCSIKSYRKKKTSTWLDCTTTCCSPSQNFWSMVFGCYRAEVIWFYGSSDLCWVSFVEKASNSSQTFVLSMFSPLSHTRAFRLWQKLSHAVSSNLTFISARFEASSKSYIGDCTKKILVFWKQTRFEFKLMG